MSDLNDAEGIADGHVRVSRLTVVSKRGEREAELVTNVNIDLGRGETIGIVGESGSGKSLSAKAIMGLLPQGLLAHGDLQYGQRKFALHDQKALANLRGSDLGLILQDPFTMLNPVMRAGRHISEGLPNARVGHGGRRNGIRSSEVARRLREVGIDDPERVARLFPFEMSGGMRQRVAIAAALARDPTILIADESTTALDVTTQAEILEVIREQQRARGMGVAMITHDLRVAFALCDRLYVFYAGSVVEVGQATDIDREPLHPYTLGLLMSEPPLDRTLARQESIPGRLPAVGSVENECLFANRCEWAREECRQGRPALQEIEPGRSTACVRIDTIRRAMNGRRLRPRPEREQVTVQGTAKYISVTSVRKAYGSKSHRKVALDDVSLEMEEGEAVALVGESGSGKTTLGRCLTGLERPDSGRIEIGGQILSGDGGLSNNDRIELAHKVQMVFQDPYSTLNPARTIGTALREALLVGGTSKDELDREVAKVLELVGLKSEYSNRRPAALSGGERQRVAIARAISARPKILVCDEIVSALDVSVQAQILNLLTDLKTQLGVGLLFISHDLAVVRQIADRIYVLFQGRLVEYGEATKVLEDPEHEYTRELIASVPGAGYLQRNEVV